MYDKIKNGTKKQTIRPYETYVYSAIGDRIHCYSTKKVEGIRRRILDELLYLGTVTSVKLTFWYGIKFNEAIAQLDGFESCDEMIRWFTNRYGPDIDDKKFRIIQWK